VLKAIMPNLKKETAYKQSKFSKASAEPRRVAAIAICKRLTEVKTEATSILVETATAEGGKNWDEEKQIADSTNGAEQGKNHARILRASH
jgi:hypothetical protein